MARIRTVKPEFMRHEKLQDLEVANPGSCVMLLFVGLWMQCDKNGVFEYKPRQLKLDILPFIEYDIVASLLLLSEAKIISLLVHDDKAYGFIPSFKKHQRIGGKEAQDPSKFPDPSEMLDYKGHIIKEAVEKHQGSTGEAQGKHQGLQEGKGKEREGNKHLADYSAEFETFWKQYPRKTNKDSAYKAWKKIKCPAQTLQEIIAALEWQKATKKWNEQNGQFIPYPASYLNAGGWKDEPELIEVPAWKII